jgi:glucose/arabinose dehydrogenase
MRYMRVRWAVALVVVLDMGWPGEGRATIVDPALTETTFVTSPALDGITALAWAPDGSNRLFVAVQNGEVRIIENGVLLDAPFATVRPILAAGEMGLLGIAFGPRFVVDHQVYLFASVSVSEQQIIRYTAAGDVGTDKTVIVAGLPTGGANHNGGGIGIGPDGKLYWSIGDNGNNSLANDDLRSLAAKVSRANLDGSPVASNPFFDGTGPNADHIWARGLRNPFSLTFQPGTGQLWVNVVGAGFEQVFVVTSGANAGWNLYENNQPDPFLTPVISYGTNRVLTLPVLAPASPGAVRFGGNITVNTDGVHNFRRGAKITLAGVADPSFNGDVFVASVPTPRSFTAGQLGPNASSGGGTVTTQTIGGCITGGAFYDATAFPASYRGNFLFGDYNSGRVERVVLDASNAILSVDHFTTDITNVVDVVSGPEGALYYASHRGVIYRADARPTTTQHLVVSPTNLWMLAGQRSVVMVRLAVAPAASTTVKVALAKANQGVTLISPPTLAFDATNWSTPQPVTIASSLFWGQSTNTVTFTSSDGSALVEEVRVNVRDDDPLRVTVAPTMVTLRKGGTANFGVALSRPPPEDVSVTVTRFQGRADVLLSTDDPMVPASPAFVTLTFPAATTVTSRMVTLTAPLPNYGIDGMALFLVDLGGSVIATVIEDDGGVSDAGSDAGPSDVGLADTAPFADGSIVDAGPSDAASDLASDVAWPDAAWPDATADVPFVDAARIDAASADAPGGPQDAGVTRPPDHGGCGCQTPGAVPRSGRPVILVAAAALGLRWRRRGRRQVEGRTEWRG